MMSVALKNDTDQSDTTIKNNYHRKLIVLIEEKILTVKNFNCTANRDGRSVHKIRDSEYHHFLSYARNTSSYVITTIYYSRFSVNVLCTCINI